MSPLLPLLFVCLTAGGVREFRDTPCPAAQARPAADISGIRTWPSTTDYRGWLGQPATDGSQLQVIGYDAWGRPAGYLVPAGTARAFITVDPAGRAPSHHRR